MAGSTSTKPSSRHPAAISFISPFESAASARPVQILPPPSVPRAATGSKLVELGMDRRGSHAHVRQPLLEDRRRNSVDVGALLKQKDLRGHKRSRKESGGHVEHQQARGREAMFAEHLSAILTHAITLCSGSGETALDLFARGEVSPISTPFDPPLIHPAPLLPAEPSTDYFSSYRPKRMPSIPDISPARRNRLIVLLQSWGFNALELDQDELWECACIMFEGCLRMEGVEPGVSMQQIRGLVYSLRSGYHARNGYHNFSHAVDVMQALYSFLVSLQLLTPLSVLVDKTTSARWARPAHMKAPHALGNIVRPMDAFTLLIAGIGHDVGHPGLSNAYMVNAKTPVAQVYGDKSALENFHTVTLIQMLQKHGLGDLFGSPNAVRSPSDKDCRRVLFASVLATDMSRHFPIVAKLQELSRCRTKRPGVDHRLRDDDRLLVCSTLMKCADISNPTRPHFIAKAWSTALLEEWSVQAKIEAEFELPISVMVLNPSEEQAQAKSQVGFINLFSQPLYDGLAGLIPAFEEFAMHCREGRQGWEAVMARARPPDSPPAIMHQELTPRLPSESRMIDEPAGPWGTRRKAPPRPLNFSTLRERSSTDSESSIASSSMLSPASPIFSEARMSSISSVSSAGLSSSPISSSPFIASKALQCTGICMTVTAKCAACVAKERAALAKNGTPEKRRPSFMPLGQLSGNPRQLSDAWPPLPFYPQ